MVEPNHPRHSTLEAALRRQFLRSYVDYQTALLIKGGLQILSWPQSYRSLRAQLIAYSAITASHATLRRQTAAEIGRCDGITKSAALADVVTAAGAGVVSSQLAGSWERLHDQDWAIGAWLWTSAGAAVLARRNATRNAGSAIAAVPMFRSLLGHEPSISRIEASGLIFNWIAFAYAGRRFASDVLGRARQIDELSANAATQRVATAEEQATFEMHSSILLDAAETLARIRTALAEDRQRAAGLANQAEARFRPWAADKTPPPPPDWQPLLGGTAGEDIRNAIANTERVVRIVEAGVLVTNIVLSSKPVIKKKWIAIALVATGSNLIHAVTRRVGRNRHTAQVLVPDVVTATTVLVAERLATGARTPPQWSLPYVQGMAGTMGPTTKSTKSAVLWSLPVAAATAIAGWVRFKAAPHPIVRAAADATFVTATLLTTQRFAGIGSELARGAEAAATELADADAMRRLVARRRDAQVFVHDTVLQVLAFVQKPDMPREVLLAWIDDELHRIALAVEGEIEHLSPDTRASLDELLGGMRRRGLDIEATLTGEPIILPITASRLAVAVVNEGLTNALKHSPDRRATVQVTRTGLGWRIGIANALPDSIEAIEDGVGLANLRRRCDEEHMEFRTAAADGTFMLTLTIHP